MSQKGSSKFFAIEVEQLRAARALLGWSQTQLAEKAGLSRSHSEARRKRGWCEGVRSCHVMLYSAHWRRQASNSSTKTAAAQACACAGASGRRRPGSLEGRAVWSGQLVEPSLGRRNYSTRHIFPAVPACRLSRQRRTGALALGHVKCEPGDQLAGDLFHGSRPDFERQQRPHLVGQRGRQRVGDLGHPRVPAT